MVAFERRSEISLSFFSRFVHERAGELHRLEREDLVVELVHALAVLPHLLARRLDVLVDVGHVLVELEEIVDLLLERAFDGRRARGTARTCSMPAGVRTSTVRNTGVASSIVTSVFA